MMTETQAHDTTNLHQQPLPTPDRSPVPTRPSGRQGHATDVVAMSCAILFLLTAVAAILIRSMGMLWSDGSTIGWVIGGVMLTLFGAIAIIGLLRKSSNVETPTAVID